VIVEPLRVKGLKGRVMPILESLGARDGRDPFPLRPKQDLATIAQFMAELTATLRQETAKLKQAKPQPGIEHR
jgi:hypothetical protein